MVRIHRMQKIFPQSIILTALDSCILCQIRIIFVYNYPDLYTLLSLLFML